jgi:oligopeptide/dipeptide ABC transporter ATP-binding protein
MSEPLLAVRGLRVAVPSDAGPMRILDHVDFVVRQGRIVGVVGESGCGKSTLLRAILGILPRHSTIEAGSIRFEGRDLLALSERHLQREVRGHGIGFVPQDPYLALNPVFTVGAQLLALMREHSKLPRVGHRTHLIATLTGLRLRQPEALLDRYPHQMSGGQRQRLLIGGALAMAPRMIVADEPTTALDAITQYQILALLRGLATQRGLSLLFVTHDLGAAAQLCDEVCVMYAGQIVESGPTRRVLGTPLHPYTAALLACHPERNPKPSGIPGQVPSPAAAPSGCHFAARCSHAEAACVQRTPALRSAGPDHLVDCRLFD